MGPNYTYMILDFALFVKRSQRFLKVEISVVALTAQDDRDASFGFMSR